MKTPRLILTCILLTLVAALPAMAGPRTFVSGLGNDANPGTREQPKRTFASALTVTDASGEVVVLDPAGFASSTLTISKSVSIIVPAGIFGGIRVTSGNAITVAAGSNDTVVLRGLTLNSGGGTNGIQINSAKAVRVENCVISGFSSNGLLSLSPADLTIKDSLIRDNASGVTLSGPSYGPSGTIERCRIEGTGGIGTGLAAHDGARIALTESGVSGFNTGIRAYGSFGSGTRDSWGLLTVNNCTVSRNTLGVLADSEGQIHLGFSTISLNGTGVRIQNSGEVYSIANNMVLGNLTSEVDGSIIFVSPK